MVEALAEDEVPCEVDAKRKRTSEEEEEEEL
jgi:hypothetical protein